MNTTKKAVFFALLLACVAGLRFCYLDVLWAEENLPLAAAAQMRGGKALYREAWFDKPPLLAAIYLAWGARDGAPLRVAGSLYVLLACWLAYRFARDLWGEAEGMWSAGDRKSVV